MTDPDITELGLGDLSEEDWEKVLAAINGGWTDLGRIHGVIMGVPPEGHIDEPAKPIS